MKNKRILSAVLASQLVLCGNSIFTPKANAGVISKTIENTLDVTFTALKYLIIGGSIVAATAISTEVAMAICSETLCEHAYTPYALENAGITIEEDVDEQYKKSPTDEGYMPFHMWCNEQGVQPVCKLGVPVPGLYEYEETYYFLVGNQGINLGAVKEKALESAKSICQKAITLAINTGSNIIDCIKKVLPAFRAEPATEYYKID